MCPCYVSAAIIRMFKKMCFEPRFKRFDPQDKRNHDSIMKNHDTCSIPKKISMQPQKSASSLSDPPIKY